MQKEEKKENSIEERKRFTVVNVDKKARTHDRPEKMMDTYCSRRLRGKNTNFFRLLPSIQSTYILSKRKLCL